jgi:CRISPR-associated protein Cas6
MFNAEWEVVRDFEHDSPITDLQFSLDGRALPEDHGLTLFDAIRPLLPWLGDAPGTGIHPVTAPASGRDDASLVLNRRSKLLLRIPTARLDDARKLSGTTIDPGCGEIRIGTAKPKPLVPFGTLYTPLLALDTDDEIAFMQRVEAILTELGIRETTLLCGKRRTIRAPEGQLTGFSLMIHNLSMPDSLTVQTTGMGRDHGLGCGLFVPHKSIKEVAID